MTVWGLVTLAVPWWFATRGGAAWSARRAHNPEVAGSNPAPATTETPLRRGFCFSGSSDGLRMVTALAAVACEAAPARPRDVDGGNHPLPGPETSCSIRATEASEGRMRALDRVIEERDRREPGFAAAVRAELAEIRAFDDVVNVVL